MSHNQFNNVAMSARQTVDFFTNLRRREKRAEPGKVIKHWEKVGALSIGALNLLKILEETARYYQSTFDKDVKKALHLRLLKTLPLILAKLSHQDFFLNLRNSNSLLESLVSLRAQPPEDLIAFLDKNDTEQIKNAHTPVAPYNLTHNFVLKVQLDHKVSDEYLDALIANYETLGPAEYAHNTASILYRCAITHAIHDHKKAGAFADTIINRFDFSQTPHNTKDMRQIAQALHWFGLKQENYTHVSETRDKSKTEHEWADAFNMAGNRMVDPPIAPIGIDHKIDFGFLTGQYIVFAEYDGPTHSLWHYDENTEKFVPGGLDGNTLFQSMLLRRQILGANENHPDNDVSLKLLRIGNPLTRMMLQHGISAAEAAHQITESIATTNGTALAARSLDPETLEIPITRIFEGRELQVSPN